MKNLGRSLVVSVADWTAGHLPNGVKILLYRSSLISRLVRRQLNRAVPSGLTEVVIRSGILKGMRLRLNLKEEKYYWLGTYELDVLRAVLDFVIPGMVVYDLGANIGYFSMVFALAVGHRGKVFAFEPMPDNSERIKGHIVRNWLTDAVAIIPKAISDRDGRAVFLIHELSAMGRLSDTKGRNEKYIAQVEVLTTSLDNFVFKLGNPSPDVVKIDIEGGGEKAIPGMTRVLKECRPIILMELHGPEESHVAWGALKEAGYRICRLEKGYPEIINEKLVQWKEYILARPISNDQ